MVVTNEALLELIKTAKGLVERQDFKTLISALITLAENVPQELEREVRDIIPAVVNVASTGVMENPDTESLNILLDNLRDNLLKHMEKIEVA